MRPQKRVVVDGLLIRLGRFPARMALEQEINGPLGGADVHHRKLRLGQGTQPEAGQDVIVEGPVGFPGIDQDPVAVVDDHLEQPYLRFRTGSQAQLGNQRNVEQPPRLFLGRRGRLPYISFS